MRAIMFLSVYYMSISYILLPLWGRLLQRDAYWNRGARIEEMTLNKNGGAYWNEVCTSQ